MWLWADGVHGGVPEFDGYWSNIRNTSVLAFCFRSLHLQAIKCFPLISSGLTRSTVDRWLSNEDWMWYTAAQHVRRKSDLCMTDTNIHAVNGIWMMDLSLNVWLTYLTIQSLNENRVLAETLCILQVETHFPSISEFRAKLQITSTWRHDERSENTI